MYALAWRKVHEREKNSSPDNWIPKASTYERGPALQWLQNLLGKGDGEYSREQRKQVESLLGCGAVVLTYI